MTQWCLTYPGFTFSLILCVLILATCTISLAIRHRTLRKIGYPPAHCDADGDAYDEDDDDEGSDASA